ncbi:uncharacterized protein LOC129778521 [Toxorhynchites rutilus septentrionalis]|uniref:uncharacterized protein LOC129778521 n=1 Tax=Toxorhynchites rutilus septentrionalis TaxID=329112 RepID=UPI00247B2109|nr:uncharacterized protein LOC129778521 [Toxorhynchites rutilus septentrionalis]
MAAVVDPRKRSREEDVNEFMPLSKRINNLHLNNSQAGGFANEHPTGAHMPVLEGHQNNFPQGGSSSSSASTCHSIPSGGSSPSATRSSYSQEPLTVNGEVLGDYCPDLSERDNPHYFDRNKILYELYVERMRRMQ